MTAISAARHLHSVDAETGEIQPGGCPRCQELEDQLAGAEKELRAWRTRYANAVRDRDTDARNHPRFEDGARWHALWRELCNHPRSRYGPEEFWLILPFLKDEVMSGFIERAIRGAAFDPHRYRRRNGSWKRCDEWSRIFKSKSSFREFVAKAPREQAA